MSKAKHPDPNDECPLCGRPYPTGKRAKADQCDACRGEAVTLMKRARIDALPQTLGTKVR